MSRVGGLFRAASVLWRQPAVWAWPIAAALIARGSARAPTHEEALVGYYLPALGLLWIGCLPSLLRRRRARPEPEPPFLPRRLLRWVTAAVLIAATVVRLWGIFTWPPEGIGFEESQIAARGHMGPSVLRNLIVAYSPPGEHALTAYTISVAFALLGPGFIQMRMPFILAGIACVWLLYAVCRRLVAWEVALFAVALFGVSWWQIAASRVADEIFLPIWVELAILWLLIELGETGAAWAGYLLALLSGLLFYEYTSYHLVAPLLIGYGVARGLLFAARVRWRTPAGARAATIGAAARTYGPAIVVMLLVWLTVAHLQLVHDVRQGLASWAAGGVGGHAEDADGLLVQLRTPETLPAFLRRRLEIPVRLAYQTEVGGYCLHLGIGSHHAAFDAATAAALGLGVVLTAATIWRPFHAITLAWAAVIVAGAALLPQNQNPHRYYTGLPLFYLLIALGANVLWRLVRQPAGRWLLLALFAGTVGYAAAENLHYLFWRMIPDKTMELSWRWPRTEVIKWIRAHRRDEWICVIADDAREIEGANPLQPEWEWLVDGWNIQISETGADCIPAGGKDESGLYYVDARPAPDSEVESLLHAFYPQVQERAPIALPERHFIARTFYVPPNGAR